MRHCDGRLFDGSACNNDLIECGDCGTSGCVGDGCDNQRYAADACECGHELTGRVLAAAV